MGIATVSFPAGALAPTTNGRIVFSRTDPFGNSLDYTANPDGSHERLLFPGQAEWAHWSPNGNEIAVRHADDLAATIVDPDTGTTRDLAIPDPVFACTPTTSLEDCQNTDFSCPSWSPDGARLACSAISGVDPSRDGVYTIRSSDGGDLTLIKSCPPACGFVGDFSPDGKRLSFVGLDANGQLRVSVIKLNGSGLRRLTPAGMTLNDEFGVSWSQRGDLILFPARPAPDDRFAIWVVRSDGTGLHQVPIPSCGGALSDPASIGCPQADWSPDGKKIVFTRVSAMGTQLNIYTVNADGRDLYQVTHGGQDSLPDWGTCPQRREG
jgi:Tol biopolymer transport system component